MFKTLFFLFLIISLDLRALEYLSCQECSNDDQLEEAIGESFKLCLRKVGLTSEDCFAKKYKILWGVTDWDEAYFVRTIIPDEDCDDGQYEEHAYHILKCQDYRFAISQVYTDLGLLWKSLKAGQLNRIKGFQKLILQCNHDLERHTKNLSNATSKAYGKELLNEIDFCKRVIDSRKEEIADTKKYINQRRAQYLKNQKIAQETEKKINKQFLEQFDWCLKQHKHPQALYERGMLYFSLGQTLKALEDIECLIDKAKEEGTEEELKKCLLEKGKCESELGLYHQAILSLSELLQIDPFNKEAYLERAVAFFESGDIDTALQDYLACEIKPKPLDTTFSSKVDFALGLSSGIYKGSSTVAADFIPSLLSSMKGLGEALWAFAESPIQVSADLVDGVVEGIEYILKSTPQELVSTLVPECKDLLKKWDHLGHYEKGEKAGFILGKYGLELFLCKKLAEGAKVFRDLRRANNLLTIETAAASQSNRAALIAQAAKRAENRKKILQSANLKINSAKQGKHIVGHPHYNPALNPSILQHPDPQKLTNKFAGKGFREGTVFPGQPGYKEVVDFEEFIGYAVSDKTGEKIATTWGKIHYAKDGAHIVPTFPKKVPKK